MPDLMTALSADPRWYCPFFTKLRRTEKRWYVLCEGGTRLAFEDYRPLDRFAERYCRCEGYRDCAGARSRFEHWGVDPDER